MNESGKRFRETFESSQPFMVSIKSLVAPALGRGSRDLYGEFDPGSGRTLAACLTHASRATKGEGVTPLPESGERVSNTWVTCPGLRDNNGKPLLIPDDSCVPHGMQGKVFSVRDRPAVYQLVGGVTAYQGFDA